MGVTERWARPANSPAGASTPNAIEAHALRKAYHDRIAVSCVDLECAAGTVLGLLGPNGSGKTTLIRMLSTVLRPDAGSFSVAGLEHTEVSQIRRRIGVLPESAGYPRGETCSEWLTYHARLYGASRSEGRQVAQRLLGEVGLGDRAGSLIASLSRGMRQRLGIARSLVNSPAVLFLDEPTLGLDPLGQRTILRLVTRIARDRGVTVVLSTHMLGEVEHLCDRVVVLNLGRIVADGSVAEVVRRAAAPREAVIQVPPHLRGAAVDALTAHHLVPEEMPRDGDLGEIRLRFPGDVPPAQSSMATLRCLLDADVAVLGWSMAGGRLSDAFLAVTREAGHD